MSTDPPQGDPSPPLSAFALRVVEAVVHGKQWTATDLPPLGEGDRVLPGWLIRRLMTGHYGELARPKICINGVVIDGDVDLSYCTWTGELDLSHCRIRGSFLMPHANLKGRIHLMGAVVGSVDLSFSSIDGLFQLQEGWCYGGFYGLGMNITGSLNLRDTIIWAPYDQPNRCAIEMYRAQVGDVFFTRVVLYGGIYANGIEVGRNFRLQGSTIIARKDLGWQTGVDNPDQAVSLVSASIGSALYLHYTDANRPEWQVSGLLVLTRATCVTLRVALTTLRGVSVRLDHLRFERLLGMSADEWFGVLEATTEIGSQPYVHLAGYAADIGRSDLQRRSLIALQRRITAEFPRWSREKWLRKLWSWSVGYGYRPAFALIWLVLCTGLCAVVLMAGGDFLVYRASETVPEVRGVKSTVDAFTISMDHVLPFAGLGVAKGWSADPTGVVQLCWLTLFLVLKFLGWGMAAVGLASLTGIMRKGAE